MPSYTDTHRSAFFRIMCNLTCKKASMIVCGLFIAVIFMSYFIFFNHGPPEEIMAANKRKYGTGRQFVAGQNHAEHYDEEVVNQLNEEEKKAFDYWEEFIKKNNFVSIGEIYDGCEVKDRLMIGKTIMLPDKRWGGIKGVKSRTFLNTTFDAELTGGSFSIEVKYNGNDLFKRTFELCTLDEDYGDERIIYCPFNPGEYSFQRDKQIPLYLPKGRYETKGIVTDQNDEVIMCGFSDFSL